VQYWLETVWKKVQGFWSTARASCSNTPVLSLEAVANIRSGTVKRDDKILKEKSMVKHKSNEKAVYVLHFLRKQFFFGTNKPVGELPIGTDDRKKAGQLQYKPEVQKKDCTPKGAAQLNQLLTNSKDENHALISCKDEN